MSINSLKAGRLIRVANCEFWLIDNVTSQHVYMHNKQGEQTRVSIVELLPLIG